MKRFIVLFALCLVFVSCAQQRARNTQTDALFRATVEGNTDMVRSLVSSPGADVNATDERGNTPLLEAAPRVASLTACRAARSAHPRS